MWKACLTSEGEAEERPETSSKRSRLHPQRRTGWVVAQCDPKAGDEISLGQIQRAEEGKPIHGELLQLKPYDESGRLYEVETLYEAPATAGGGPAQVTTPEFRENFRAIFGAKRKKEEPALLN